MIDLVRNLSAFLKLENACTDNNVFRLHYKLTSLMLIAFSLLVTSKQYFGEPVDCIPGAPAINRETLNTFCWIHATFTVERHFKGSAGVDIVKPGVATHQEGKDKLTSQHYYQWVCFVLFLEALFFATPGYLWKAWEGGCIHMLAVDLGSPVLGNEWNPERKNTIVEYLADTKLRPFTVYVLRFTFCEILNFINVVLQIILLDRFLGGEFAFLGPNFIKYASSTDFGLKNQTMPSPLDHMFPKVAKCRMYYFGTSGGMSKMDSLCILPLNNINDKVFLFLWFWFVALAVVSAVALVYRAIVLLSVNTRVYLLWAKARLLPRNVAEHLGHSLPVGNWFLLTQLSKNVNPFVFVELLIELDRYLTKKTSISAKKSNTGLCLHLPHSLMVEVLIAQVTLEHITPYVACPLLDSQ
ncbi:innexin inx2-like [Schistocerca americana]|uniref:innexin inx2-like n=1 Tax=Schistocerca americana TaxID=7009 RepID=UPI001F4F9568|nr:innexin inx2-like [Schistocerca americana]